MLFNRLSAAALIGAACFAAAPTLAQDQSQNPDAVAALLRAQGETYSRAPDAEQNPAEVKTTQALNAEITAQNDLAASQENADTAAYAQAQAQYEAEVNVAGAAQAQYGADVRAAEDARLRYEADMENWRATVRACERGDSARCAVGSKRAY